MRVETPTTSGKEKVDRPGEDRYRFSGGIFRREAENFAWAAASTGLCRTLVLAGSLPRKLSPFQFFEGRTGRGAKPPPQLGQTFPRTFSTQGAQKVHSYEQMRASGECGGSGLLQFSQVGRSSSVGVAPQLLL